MKRRDFLKTAALAGGAFSLNNIPLQALSNSSMLQQLAAASTNDKVLVIVQLHGGNDGLNTIVPIDQYTDYLDLRPNIALPFSGAGSRNLQNLDPSLSSKDQIGIHPDMADLRHLYDNGQATIVQGVGYEHMNGSHFRSRDIFFMGGGYDDYLDSGWMGRYLGEKYPGYPDNYPSPQMPDPLALEIGNGLSLAFHTSNTIPTSLSINNPESFYDLIQGVIGAEGVPDGLDGSSAAPPLALDPTNYASELKWIMEFEKKSDQYAGRLRDVFRAGNNAAGVNYPELYPFSAPASARRNDLSGQLKLIARLLSGGIKTKIFLARIGGFDTHAQQVEPSATTFGSHAAKLYHIFSAVRAFQNDLKALGLADRVLTTTLTEFGRRAQSNLSWGTDHGIAAPMFVFGTKVNPGVIGTNPELRNLDRGSVPVQHDYRKIFNEIAQDWLCATPEETAAIGFDPRVASPKLGILSDPLISVDPKFKQERYRLETCFPNPVEFITTFKYRINRSAMVQINLYDSRGIWVRQLHQDDQLPGEHSFRVDLSDLEKGAYFYTLKAGEFTATKKLVKI